MNTPRPPTPNLSPTADLVRYLDHRAEIDELEIGDRAGLALWIGTLDVAERFYVPLCNRLDEARMLARSRTVSR